MESEGISIEVDDTEGEVEERRRRGGLTVHDFYEAIRSLIKVRAALKGTNYWSPDILISSTGSTCQVLLLDPTDSDPKRAREEAICGLGADVNEAFSDLIETVAKEVEELRKAKANEIDELMKRGNNIVRRMRKKKEGQQ